MIHTRQFWIWAAVLIFLGANPSAWAHDPGLSVATARLGEKTIAVHLALARTDAEQIVPLDADRDGKVSEIEFQNALPELQRRARGCYEVLGGDKKLAPDYLAIERDDKDGIHFNLIYSGVTGGQLVIRAAWLADFARGHREYFSVQDQAQHIVSERMLDASHDTITVTLAAPASAPAVMVQHSFREFLSLGVEHIATGYDHLLFLFGLLVVGGNLRSALKIITSFTVAHSLTLALATLHVIHLSSRVVEPLIAVSIVYVGVENLLRRKMDKRWLLTFCFGLIHGCGFASALSDLGVGANGTPILLPLVSFNLGVELGQLAVAALVLPLIWKCRASPVLFARLVPVGSALIALAGGYWLVERTLL